MKLPCNGDELQINLCRVLATLRKPSLPRAVHGLSDCKERSGVGELRLVGMDAFNPSARRCRSVSCLRTGDVDQGMELVMEKA
jgi:hypothetical protein